MEKTEVILTIAPAAWCAAAAVMLETTIRGAPCYTIADLEAEVRAGGAALYAIAPQDGEPVAYVVLRLETYQGGTEGVIVAAAGKLRGASLYRDLLPAIERMFIGCKSLRIESCRRGAADTLLELGYLPTHAIFRKPIGAAAGEAASESAIAGDDRLEELQRAGGEACGDGRRGSAGGDLRSRPGKLHGGGGGSSSSSSSQTTTNQDRRIVADNGAVAISAEGSVTLNTLDGGAIEKAFEFAKASDQETGKTLNQALGITAAVFDKASTQIEKAYNDARGAGEQKTILAGAALALVAVVALKVFAK